MWVYSLTFSTEGMQTEKYIDTDFLVELNKRHVWHILLLFLSSILDVREEGFITNRDSAPFALPGLPDTQACELIS